MFKCTCFLSDLDRNNGKKAIFLGHMCIKHVKGKFHGFPALSPYRFIVT